MFWREFMKLKVLCALAISLSYMFVSSGASCADESPVKAIDIVLEPDATMIRHAQDANFPFGNK